MSNRTNCASSANDRLQTAGRLKADTQHRQCRQWQQQGIEQSAGGQIDRRVAGCFGAKAVLGATAPLHGIQVQTRSRIHHRCARLSSIEGTHRGAAGQLQGQQRDWLAVKQMRDAIARRLECSVVLKNYRKDNSLFWNNLFLAPVPDDQGDISHYIGIQTDITAQKQYEQELAHNASHDLLTGLPNRSLLRDRLSQSCSISQRHAQKVAVLFIDLDGFKLINDSLGHLTGDELLKRLSRKIATQIRPGDTLARLGGDEFLLLHQRQLAEPLLQQLTQQLSLDYKLQDSSLNLTLALALYRPDSLQTVTAGDALRRVDIAMMHAKQRNDHIAVYQQGQDESHQRELKLIRDLPDALHNGQFYAVYQPKIDLASQQCHSAEALIRWQHPKLGPIAPDEFIRLAEHSGNISLISDWMLQQVIAQTAKWWQQGLRLQIAVNLSVHDLLNPALADNINAQLQQYKLSAAALALEVTESAIMQDAATVIAQLQRIRSLGITLAIDDFGTGQSSLAYLKQLPVHEIKIDRAFVKDIEHNSNDALIVAATTQLAHSLGFIVTAEGLENQAG